MHLEERQGLGKLGQKRQHKCFLFGLLYSRRPYADEALIFCGFRQVQQKAFGLILQESVHIKEQYDYQSVNRRIHIAAEIGFDSTNSNSKVLFRIHDLKLISFPTIVNLVTHSDIQLDQ